MQRVAADVHFFTSLSYMMAAPLVYDWRSLWLFLRLRPLGEATVLRGHLEDGKQARARDSNSLLEHAALPRPLVSVPHASHRLPPD